MLSQSVVYVLSHVLVYLVPFAGICCPIDMVYVVPFSGVFCPISWYNYPIWWYMLSHLLVYVVPFAGIYCPFVVYFVPFGTIKWDNIYHRRDNIYHVMGQLIPTMGQDISRIFWYILSLIVVYGIA